MTTYRKKLIEVALPLEAINVQAEREGYIYKGKPTAIHKWWADRRLAAARGILFGQLVDDPSSWPSLWPTEGEQEIERQRLFRLIEELVLWENSNDERVVSNARREIALSFARGRTADAQADARDAAVLVPNPKVADVNRYLAEVAPPVHDPFAGGGSIPLEAQRLGLRAIATDLNPVAVLINKALIEIPPKFAGWKPVNPESRKSAHLKTWTGAQGLAEDVRHYGKWMRQQAREQIGDLYPDVDVPSGTDSRKATVIAWLWARTVASPNPACRGAHVPLVSSFWLSKKPGKEAWVEAVVDRTAGTWRFEVRDGAPPDAAVVSAGTKTGRGAFKCILSSDPIPSSHIHAEGKAGRLGDRLMAIAAEGKGGRIYVTPTADQERSARVPPPSWVPEFEFAKNSRHMTPWAYGLDTFAKLFTPRQLNALVTLADLVSAARENVLHDARSSGVTEGTGLADGGTGAVAYADSIAVALALSVSKMADYHCSLIAWYAGEGRTSHLFTGNALPMVWDFVENNPLCLVGGSFLNNIEIVHDAFAALTITAHSAPGIARQQDASATIAVRNTTPHVISTDPPYYDNVPYADLSDMFYVWLRRALKPLRLPETRTLLVPKSSELVADPHRHESSSAAEEFFLNGMRAAIGNARAEATDLAPIAIYYAFKQAEKGDVDRMSTGWATFLQAVTESGLAVNGTWPVRTERGARTRSQGSNALATSIVLVCRKRSATAPTITRADFRRLLRQELPAALKALQHGNIAPVDMAQASIGPGMGIYSRHAKVLEADGSAMGVRTALQLINQALDEYLAEQEGEFDPDTRFAVTWFETRAFDAGPFGEAETLAKARNVSVQGVVEAGILQAAAGKVRLLKRAELPADWDPVTDTRPTVWEAAQHLCKRLDEQGESGAADLLARLGERAAPARDLAYRLYTVCERKGWAEEARAYNGLVIAWPELEKLAGQVKVVVAPQRAQRRLFDA